MSFKLKPLFVIIADIKIASQFIFLKNSLEHYLQAVCRPGQTKNACSM